MAKDEARLAFWMLAPTFGVVALFVVFPVMWNLWLSLKTVSLAGLRDENLTDLHFTLDNFRTVFSDPQFLPSLVTSLVYTVGGSLLSVVLGLAAALLLHGSIPGRNILRGLILSPYVAPVVAVTFTWSFILDPQLGAANWLAVHHGLLSRPIPFLSQSHFTVVVAGMSLRIPLALTTVIFFEAWRYFPFAFLFILARLQVVPEQLYESAAIDGAGPINRFLHITIPQLTGVLGMLFIFRFIWTFTKFDDVFLLTSGQAGTRVLPILVYDYAFARFDIGASAALAMILFAVLAAFLIIYFAWTVRKGKNADR